MFGDAKQYHLTAEQFAVQQRPITTEAPFAYRVATPWLASAINPTVKHYMPRWLDILIDNATGLDDVLPFYLINAAAILLFTLLLLMYLAHFINSAWVRLLLAVLWLGQWHAPARWLYFNPINVEPLFLLFALAALLVIERYRDAGALRAALLIAPLTVAGTLCRESMVLVPLAWAARWRSTAFTAAGAMRALLPVTLPLLAATAALAWTRLLVEPANTYVPWAEALNMIRSKPVDAWLLAWFFTFGVPLLALIVAAHEEMRALLRRRPELAAWLIGCGLLAYIGGTDTERILGWAVPVVYLLGGVALERRWRALRRLPWLLIALAAIHVVSSRMLWPIPIGDDAAQPLGGMGLSWASLAVVADRVFVIDHYYANLWSSFGSRPLHLAILVCDVVLTVTIVLIVRRSQRAAA